MPPRQRNQSGNKNAIIKLPPEDIAELVAELDKKLQELVQNIKDREEIELTLPLFKIAFKTLNRGWKSNQELHKSNLTHYTMENEGAFLLTLRFLITLCF